MVRECPLATALGPTHGQMNADAIVVGQLSAGTGLVSPLQNCYAIRPGSAELGSFDQVDWRQDLATRLAQWSTRAASQREARSICVYE